MSHVAKKLLQVIFYLLKTNTTFVSQMQFEFQKN